MARLSQQRAGSISPEQFADEVAGQFGHRAMDVDFVALAQEGTKPALQGLIDRVVAPEVNSDDAATSGLAKDAWQLWNSDDKKWRAQFAQALWGRLAPKKQAFDSYSKPNIEGLMSYAQKQGRNLDETALKTLAEQFRKGQHANDPIAFAASAVFNPTFYNEQGVLDLPLDRLPDLLQDPAQVEGMKTALEGIKQEQALKTRRAFQQSDEFGIGDMIAPVTTNLYRNADDSPARAAADEAYIQRNAEYNTPEAIEQERERLANVRDPGAFRYGAGLLVDVIGAAAKPGQAIAGAMEGNSPIESAMANQFAGAGDPRNDPTTGEAIGGAVTQMGMPISPVAGAVTRTSQMAGRSLTNMSAAAIHMLNRSAKLPQAMRGTVQKVAQSLETARRTGSMSPDEIDRMYAGIDNTYNMNLQQGMAPEEAMSAALQTIKYGETTQAVRAIPSAVSGGIEGGAYSVADPSQDLGDNAMGFGVGAMLGGGTAYLANTAIGSKNPIQDITQSPAFRPNRDVVGSANLTRQMEEGRTGTVPMSIETQPILNQVQDETARIADMGRMPAAENIATNLRGMRGEAQERANSKLTTLHLIDELRRNGKIDDPQYEQLRRELEASGDITHTQVQQGTTYNPMTMTQDPNMINRSVGSNVAGDLDNRVLNRVMEPGTLNTPDAAKSILDAVSSYRKRAGGSNTNDPMTGYSDYLKKYDEMQKQAVIIKNTEARGTYLRTEMDNLVNNKSVMQLEQTIEKFIRSNPNNQWANDLNEVARALSEGRKQIETSLKTTVEVRKAVAKMSEMLNVKGSAALGRLLSDPSAPFVDRLADAFTRLANVVLASQASDSDGSYVQPTGEIANQK